jgi:hypothetical protein
MSAGAVAGTGERHEGRIKGCTQDAPGTAVDGGLNMNIIELTNVSGIFGDPSDLSPREFTTPNLRRFLALNSYRPRVRTHLSVNAPPGALPELVNGTKGGLSACR